MPNKRSRRKKTQNFHCPYCSRRLWRTGNKKYYLFYQGISEIKNYLNISRKRAMCLACQNNTYVDRDRWVEEFFCEKHYQLWMVLSRDDKGRISARLASDNDWRRTTGTINPDLPNPSVSQFSYRMSRRAGYPKIKDKTFNL